MTNYKAARRYTTALYGIAADLNQTDVIKEDFLNIKKSIQDSHELKLFLESPIIKPEKKLSIINSIFSSKVSDLTLSFLLLLCEKNRINILKEVSDSILKLINEKQGIIEAKITTALDMTENEKKSITQKLQKYSGKEIQPSYIVDQSIKGGFIAQIDDKIIDASILRQLDLLKEKFILGSFNN